MDTLNKLTFVKGTNSEKIALNWHAFLVKADFNFADIKNINMEGVAPIIFDQAGNKFSIDFNENKVNYHKKKSSIGSEIISRALGAGRAGKKILDISAGLGIDALFLAQLGYEVTAIERNPLIYLALEHAFQNCTGSYKSNLRFIFSSADDFLNKSTEEFDAIYFDPMFPEKTKSALPRQEMVFFKNLVGNDDDAAQVLEQCTHYKGINRVVVKRPLKAPVLALKPHSQVSGKLIRFDIYGVKNA